MQTLRNKVQLIGHLGSDPEVIDLDNEKKLVRFSLATQENYINGQGERVEQVEWHRVIAWNRHAELSEKYLKKGKEIVLEGKLQSRSFEDKEGITRYVTEVVINDMVFVGKP